MNELIQQIIDNPLPSLAIVGNMILIESLLSVDNAAVLATMVNDLPLEQRAKALRYGILGAYIFRGLAMLFASALIKIWFLKPIGGLYLLYLVYKYIKGKQEEGGNEEIDKNESWLYKTTVGKLGPFWSTVCLVELMDMAFSIDNVFAAVAYTPNIILICTGVFIGILSMRFISQIFIKLMERYPFLEDCAFILIGVLGIKLALSLIEHFSPESQFSKALSGNTADIAVSVFTILVFIVPIITSRLFKFPK